MSYYKHNNLSNERKEKIMNKVLFQIIKSLHKMGFMKTKFYKKYCYYGKVGEFFCHIVCKNM